MHQQRHPKFTHSYLDSCAFDGPEAQCCSRLLDLANQGQIHLEIAHSVAKEIDHPNTPSHVKLIARQLIHTDEAKPNPEEIQSRDAIRFAVQGNAKYDQHTNDADHIFDLWKHGGGYFITTDDRLLRLTDLLFRRYLVTTITPGEYETIATENA